MVGGVDVVKKNRAGAFFFSTCVCPRSGCNNNIMTCDCESMVFAFTACRTISHRHIIITKSRENGLFFSLFSFSSVLGGGHHASCGKQ